MPAVRWEDPRIEEALLKGKTGAQALFVATAGSAAAAVQARVPGCRVTIVAADPDEVASSEAELEERLCEFRAHLHERVASRDDWRSFLAERDATERARRLAEIARAPEWKKAFTTHLGDERFEKAVAEGLMQQDVGTNPFLRRLLVGSENEAADTQSVEHVPGPVSDVPDLGRFELVSLSDVLDRMDEASFGATVQALQRSLKPGAVIVCRRFFATATGRDLRSSLAPHFRFSDATAALLHAKDRSLFCRELLVADRVRPVPGPTPRGRA